MFLARWPDRDFNVLAKSGEEFHQASNGEISSAVAHEQGYLRLPHSENFGDIDLCQLAVLEDRVDLQGELRFEQLLLRVAKAKVRKDVSTAHGNAGNAIVSLLFFFLVFMLVPPFSMFPLGFQEPLPNQIHLPRGRRDAFCGLLLEYMQNVDGVLKTHGVDAPPGTAVTRDHDLEHAGKAEAFERLRGGIGLALLGGKERVPNVDPHLARERPQIPERRPTHLTGFSMLLSLYQYTYAHIFRSTVYTFLAWS